MVINVQTKTRGARIKNLLATRWDIVKVKKWKVMIKNWGFECSPPWLNPKLESLTMKLYSSSTNNSDGIFFVSFSVQFSIALRSVLVRFSFGSRSFFDRSSIGSRSILDHPSFILRSFSVRRSKIDRRMIEESSENHRRQDGDVSKL